MGMNGQAYVRSTTAKVRKVTFALATSATKTISLDPSKRYAVFAEGAGPSDVTLAVSGDDPAAIAAGKGKFSANKGYTALAAAGGYLGTVNGGTTLKVTHIKNGAGTDDAPTVAALGGRFQLRAVEIGFAIAEDDADLGGYTAVTADGGGG